MLRDKLISIGGRGGVISPTIHGRTEGNFVKEGLPEVLGARTIIDPSPFCVLYFARIESVGGLTCFVIEKFVLGPGTTLLRTLGGSSLRVLGVVPRKKSGRVGHCSIDLLSGEVLGFFEVNVS